MSNTQALKPEEGQSSTIVVEPDETDAPEPSVRMKLKKPKGRKKVAWSADTVDNENMNKKKSKCCCIYEKPREFGESSSESEDEDCEHCKGHTERKNVKPNDTSSDKSHLNSTEEPNK